MSQDILVHYGTPHGPSGEPHSGRYEYGSGKKYREGSYADKMDFLARYNEYKKEGKSEKEIADAFGLTIKQFRDKRSIASAERDAALKTRAIRLRNHGYGPTEIGRLMGGYSESTVRGWLKNSENLKKDKINGVADILEERLKKGEMIDVGPGAELNLGCTATTLSTALKELQDRGYFVDTLEIKQPLDPNKNTRIKYVAPPGTTRKMAWDNRNDIQPITATSPNQGVSFNEAQPPASISDERVSVLYKNEGGIERDGMIGIRPGVKDISLDGSSYAQVRILVNKDGKDAYYLKGMAFYDDSIPKGKDIQVYSNKETRYSLKKEGIEGALKEVKGDPNNPFGATITAGGQRYFEKKDGKYIQTEPDIYRLDDGKQKSIDGKHYDLSPINKLRDMGDWDNYAIRLSSQFLSKQPLKLINSQLDLTYKTKLDQFNGIMSLENKIVKQRLLNDFAAGCDKDAKDLAACGLPRQASKVLIAIPELKDNEVYAPTYKNGETLVLIRHPHEGTFEIAKLKVNNKNEAAKKILGKAPDAIGINKNVAGILSGADFDGDHAITIPLSDRVRIDAGENLSPKSPLRKLREFDPSDAYKGYPGMRIMTPRETGIEMGKISNLITDMSTQNPTEDELARATRHAMVVIDAEKHQLNWKQSEVDNGIEAWKKKYQKNPDKKKGYGGASSLVSRADSKVMIPELQMVNKEGKRTYTADPDTGKIFMAPTGEYYINKKGEKIFKKAKYSMMDLTDDARTLSNGSLQEEAYATYANRMKALANTSRKEALSIKTTKQDPIAKQTYAAEVDSLMSKLNIAWKNKPLERQAQAKTSVKIEQLAKDYPDIFGKDAKKDKANKEKAKVLAETRLQVGAGKHQIDITEREWEAIQAHAISDTTLRKILDSADMDKVRKLAMPKGDRGLSESQKARIKSLSTTGFSNKEIAEIMGFSTSTISKYLN